jgi:hypothetical protein
MGDALRRPMRLIGYSLIPFGMALVGAPVHWAMRLDHWVIPMMAWGTLALALASPLAALLLMATGYRLWWGVPTPRSRVPSRGMLHSFWGTARPLFPRRKAIPETSADASSP